MIFNRKIEKEKRYLMKRKKRPVVRTAMIVVLGALLGILLCGCVEVRLASSSAGDALIQIGETTCSRKEAVFLLLEEKAVYEDGQDPAQLWSRKIGAEDMDTYVKDVVKEQLVRYTTTEDMSDGLAVYLTEEEKKAAGDAAVASWTKISGLYDMEAYEITVEDASDLYYKRALYDAVYRKIADEATMEITEDSTRVMEADYVLIPADNGEGDAQAIYGALREGMDFAQACAENGYALLQNQVIPRGELPKDVDSVAFALRDSEFSEIIESKDGFYIFRCIDDQLLNESAANYNAVFTAAAEDAFRNAYNEYAEKVKMVFDNNYWKRLKIGELQ